MPTEVDAFLRAGFSGEADFLATIALEVFGGDFELDLALDLPLTAAALGATSFAFEALLLSLIADWEGFLSITGAFLSSLRAGEDDWTGRFSGDLAAGLAAGFEAGLADCYLGGETLFLDAGLPEDTTAAGWTFLSGNYHHMGATETERYGLLADEGATVALLLALVTFSSALRAAFSSLLRMGAATFATLLPLLRSAEGLGASFFFMTVTLRMTFGGLTIFLSFLSDLGALRAGFRVLAGETGFLAGAAYLALD